MIGGFSRFIGVDFSAAADGGRRTWIAITQPAAAGGLRLIDLHPACDLPGGDPAPRRFVPALGDWLARQTGALAGLDFPFSLPERLIDAEDWPSFVLGFAGRHPDPDAFRESCRTRTGGRELRRRCDGEARTPFSAYNLRLYRQTWWGIAGLLAPLVRSGRAQVAPMHLPAGSAVTLAETCPASTLKRLSCRDSYKGAGPNCRSARCAILARLAVEGLAIPAAAAETALSDRGGDALDSMIAAYAAWDCARHRSADLAGPRDRLDRLEARVYF